MSYSLYPSQESVYITSSEHSELVVSVGAVIPIDSPVDFMFERNENIAIAHTDY